jgi:hypothetical protein
MDVPEIVPCMPGAQLVETVDENTWKATMAVKLGPIALNFATDVVREATDEASNSVTLNVRARETRGRGGAQAAIQSSLAEVPGGTRVDIVTDLTMSGAVAQYGRGIVQDVAAQMTNTFAECLKGKLAPAADASAAAETSGDGAAAMQAAPVKPVQGLRVGLRAVGHVISGFFKGLFHREPKS